MPPCVGKGCRQIRVATGSRSSYGSIIRNNIFSNGVFSGPWPGSYTWQLEGATVSNNLAASDALFVDATNPNMIMRIKDCMTDEDFDELVL